MTGLLHHPHSVGVDCTQASQVGNSLQWSWQRHTATRLQIATMVMKRIDLTMLVRTRKKLKRVDKKPLLQKKCKELKIKLDVHLSMIKKRKI